MKPIILIAFLFSFCDALCQTGDMRNRVCLSVPVIRNHSEATFYRLGNPERPSGKAMSYGINLNYSRQFDKNIYAIVGMGYFRQKFQIIRPLNYQDPRGYQILYGTRWYHYDNMHLFSGLGYRKALGRDIWLKGEATYNLLRSFRQKYFNSEALILVYRESLPIGQFVSLSTGAGHSIGKNLSIGLDLVFPVLHHWNNDDMFIESAWSDDVQQIARNKFSIGSTLNFYYRF